MRGHIKRPDLLARGGIEASYFALAGHDIQLFLQQSRGRHHRTAKVALPDQFARHFIERVALTVARSKINMLVIDSGLDQDSITDREVPALFA